MNNNIILNVVCYTVVHFTYTNKQTNKQKKTFFYYHHIVVVVVVIFFLHMAYAYVCSFMVSVIQMNMVFILLCKHTITSMMDVNANAIIPVHITQTTDGDTETCRLCSTRCNFFKGVLCIGCMEYWVCSRQCWMKSGHMHTCKMVVPLLVTPQREEEEEQQQQQQQQQQQYNNNNNNSTTVDMPFAVVNGSRGYSISRANATRILRQQRSSMTKSQRRNVKRVGGLRKRYK